jgi:molybdopterin-synthase adenylyltransferase
LNHALRRNENVFPFNAHLASWLIMHALNIAFNPMGIADVGEQFYHFVDGTLDSARGVNCYENCYFSSVVGRGDLESLPITGVDIGALKARLPNKRRRHLTRGARVRR